MQRSEVSGSDGAERRYEVPYIVKFNFGCQILYSLKLVHIRSIYHYDIKERAFSFGVDVSPILIS